MAQREGQMVQINNTDWYVETRTGLEGPFETRKDAQVFQKLMARADAARAEFAGLQFSPKN